MTEETYRELHKKIGNILRLRRESINLSQQEVAEHVNVTKSAISRWESGEVENIGRSKIQKLAEILKISPISIVLGTDVDTAVVYKTKKVPVLGAIACGEPILIAEETRDYYIEIDDHTAVDFCLRVKGDSMIEARINDGDMVFIHAQPVVENGEIAVVAIDNEVTLKRFYRTDKGIILKPENSLYQPIFFSEGDFKEIKILGKAVSFQSKL